MSLKIENAEQLQKLITENGLAVESIDELRDLLVDLQGQDPTLRREQAAAKERRQKEAQDHKERLQEHAQAHTERMREMDHAERLRAIEMGQPLPDPGEVALARTAIRAAAGIGIVVSIFVTLGAVGLSAIILTLEAGRSISFFGVSADFQTTLFTILWGVVGLVLLVTIEAALRTARHERQWTTPTTTARPAPAPRPVHMDPKELPLEQAR